MKKIYAICTTLDAGYDGDRKRISDSGINIGDKIELDNACVGGWSTEVYLVGYEGSFNSVFFNFVVRMEKNMISITIKIFSHIGRNQ